MTINLKNIAEATLERLHAAGFDSAQVSISVSEQDELNITNNQASLLRSTEDYHLSLIGIVDGRKAAGMLTDLEDSAITHTVGELIKRAEIAPQDDANAVSAGQVGRFEQGPQTCDLELLVKKVEELLAFRARETPKMSIDEGAALHRLVHEQVLTSEGSDLSCAVGSYGLSAFGTAKDGDKSSSFNAAGGRTNDLSIAPGYELFGIGTMLRETERQIETIPLGGNFVGDVILAPTAVEDLLGWLIGQLSDMALISDGSVYKNRIGDIIASPLLSVRSRFDAPGQAPYTGDAFLAPAINLVDKGRLTTLLPGYYGSRKTGLKHTPCGSGWSIDPGELTRNDLIASVKQGALVSRLSMGSPGANGDFSGVIKNSFIIREGKLGSALSESMVSGNMAKMLQEISGISKERLDLGSENFPWIRIPNLHFS